MGRALRNTHDLYLQSSAQQMDGTDFAFVTRGGRCSHHSQFIKTLKTQTRD
jgi:hypothetical protein